MKIFGVAHARNPLTKPRIADRLRKRRLERIGNGGIDFHPRMHSVGCFRTPLKSCRNAVMRRKLRLHPGDLLLQDICIRNGNTIVDIKIHLRAVNE